MRTNTTRRGSSARWGWLITTLALGAVVIASAWASYRSARRASDEVIRGEAHTLRDAILASHRPGQEALADLDSLVAAERGAGLRYAAWVRQDGALVASGGERATPRLEVPVAADPTFERVENRIRVYFPPPNPPKPLAGPSVAAGAAGVSDRPAPPTIVMEFEPVVAVDLLDRARRALVVAGIVATLLMAGGLVFWRMSQRIEAGELRIAEQRRLTALGEMSAMLAHEIRNPLASLKGNAQLLLERMPDDSAGRRKAERVVEEAERLEVLTSDLLDFARSGPLDLQQVDPVALLRASANEVSDTIEIDGHDVRERWLLDERRFGQAVLGNLLRNAVQAAPASRPPLARVRLENRSLVFTIRDFGPGLPEGLEERIFDAFVTTRTAGTGLGLPVARRIVELHGGHITAANALDGSGAVFRVELPRRNG